MKRLSYGWRVVLLLVVLLPFAAIAENAKESDIDAYTFQVDYVDTFSKYSYLKFGHLIK